MLSDCRRNALHQFDLFVSQETSTLDQNDTRVQLTFADELLEVADVQRDEDAILLVRALKQLVIGRAFEPTIANVPRVDAVGGERDGGSRRDVSSSRSLTTTRTTDARIRGGVSLREFHVLFAQARIVGGDLLHRGSTARHLADVAYREPALREYGLATKDVVALDELLLPLLEVAQPGLDVVYSSIDLHDEIRTQLDVMRLLRAHRGHDHAVQLLAILDVQLETDSGDRVEVNDIREIKARRALDPLEHAVLHVLANPSLVQVEEGRNLGGGQLGHKSFPVQGTLWHDCSKCVVSRRRFASTSVQEARIQPTQGGWNHSDESTPFDTSRRRF